MSRSRTLRSHLQFRNLCDTAWEKPHGFVVIDVSSEKNNGKYRIGLDEFCIPNQDYLGYKKMEHKLLKKIMLNTETKETFSNLDYRQ